MSPHRPPRLIPVLDVMNGHVVRAVGGRRDEYRPIASTLTPSTEPVDVARALLAATGANELYVADLDAIRGRNGISPAVHDLTTRFEIPIWLDSGLSHPRSTATASHEQKLRPVVALESASDPEAAGGVGATAVEPRAFSLDLKDGRLLGDWARWAATDERDALAVVRTAAACGFRTLIVLDLARVGTGTGTGTEPLLRAIRTEFPGVDLLAGGGVRTWADVERLGEAGATGVLVASALHDGTLTPPRPTS